MKNKQNNINFVRAYSNRYGIFATITSGLLALFAVYFLTHFKILEKIQELTNQDIWYVVIVAGGCTIAGIAVLAMLINSLRKRLFITDALAFSIFITTATGIGIYFLDPLIQEERLPTYIIIFINAAVGSLLLLCVHGFLFDRNGVQLYKTYRREKRDATIKTYYKEVNRTVSLLILGIVAIGAGLGLYWLDLNFDMKSTLIASDEEQRIFVVMSTILLITVAISIVERLINKRVNTIDNYVFGMLVTSITCIIVFGIKYLRGNANDYTALILIVFTGFLIINTVYTIALILCTHTTKTIDIEVAKAEIPKEEENPEIPIEELQEENEEELKEEVEQEEETKEEQEDNNEPKETEGDNIVSEKAEDIVLTLAQDNDDEEEDLDMSLIQQLIDAQKEQTQLLAERFEEQAKFNNLVSQRLENMDKNIKYIADVLGGLSMDAVPNANAIQVSLDESQEDAVVQEIEPQQEEIELAPAEEEELPIEEAPEIETTDEDIAPAEEGTEDDNWVDTANDIVRIKPKMSFDMRLRVADDDIKRFYSDIKNALLSYGVHDRVSRHRENFNQGRINIARMVINGKTLKVYLAVDPETIDKRYFHQVDAGYRKSLVDLPTMINVRSKVAARKVIELIDLIMESLVISKKKYEPVDFAAQLTLDGFTVAETKGYDYLVKKSVKLEDVIPYTDEFAGQLLEPVEDEEYHERFIKTELTIDDIVANFEPGSTVDINAVREKGIGAPNANYLSVKESASLNKKFKVYANEFTANAIKMISLVGGETFLVVQPNPTVEEV